MTTKNPKTPTDRLLTPVIILLSVGGVLYFGLSSVRDNARNNQRNPFEYNIERFKKSGEAQVAFRETAAVALDLNKPYALATYRGRIYVTGDRSLLILAGDGRLLATAATERPISALAVDANGDLYAAAGESVQVLDSTGVKKAQWQDLGVDAILTSVAVGEKDVYLADAGQLIVWRFNKGGELLGRIGAKDPAKDIPGFVIPSPYFDLAVDADGFLWVVNSGRHQFENYTPDGRLRSFWSRSSMAIDGFSGCCNPSHFALLEDGSFVTSEKGIPRVKIHNVLGDLSAVVAGADQFDEDTVGLDLAVDESGRILVLDPKRRQVRIFTKKEE